MLQAASAIRARGARAVLVKGGHLWKDEGGPFKRAGESLGPRASRPPHSHLKSSGIDLASDAEPRAGGSGKRAGETPAVPVVEAIDVLDDEGSVTIFRGAWVDAGNVRGTGCMLSAAIAAFLAKGMCLENSVAEAKRFVSDSISRSGV
jgi:hydroxymethylpyrimidine/phosphomethylpyrimidine kinase